ncbi:uncharacterized protein LOC122363554 [Amphibalanus amphitrite]|uniref:uncharacterized protein LOC122363554 n=1 Tax=Amphibalanus amphitrite TaxID=1232801 RepID=UPI001C8FCF1F|nr:uncharacterized protein LOC122363554 [Amphibalanus amphitrite]XP_043188916.1 uncharacterized protein LOC122363554 [Amphibalanus amphitrite]
MGGRQLLSGLFPSTACMKLAGVFKDTGERVLVRGCALDSGQLVPDSDVVQVVHCGGLIFQDRHVHGCLQSCAEEDGCNGSQSWFSSLSLTALLTAASAVLR